MMSYIFKKILRILVFITASLKFTFCKIIDFKRKNENKNVPRKINTTVDKNAPILLQWIVPDIKYLNYRTVLDRHPLPNTAFFTYRQRLVNLAEMEPDRLICLYYFGSTLTLQQNKQMKDLERLACNIRVINFDKLDWSEYDFEFNTSVISENEGENMKISEYLRLSNLDNRMLFRLNIMKILMLLKAEQGILEVNGQKNWNKRIGKGALFFDFDYILNNRIKELKAPYGILTGYYKDYKNVFNFFHFEVASVTESKNVALANAWKLIKRFLETGGIRKNYKFDCGLLDFVCGYRRFDFIQHYFTMFCVAISIAELIVERSSKETQKKIKKNNKKYEILSELITNEKIDFLYAVETSRNLNSGPIFVQTNFDTEHFCRNVISENLDTCKYFKSNLVFADIFNIMYKLTEFKIKKKSKYV